MDNNQKSSADHIVEHLLAIDVDGETIEYIIDGTHMREQVLKQLAMKASDQDLNTIMSERDAIHDRGRNSHFTPYKKPNTIQAPINAYYLFRCDDPKRPSWMPTDLHLDLFEMERVIEIRRRLDADKVNYDLVVERFDPDTNSVLSNDYIVEKNCESSSRTEEIPLEQRYLIKRALDFYIKTSKSMVRNPSDDDHYEWFDMHALSEMMEYPIHIEISQKEKEEFGSKHNVDFPKWV
jgi:hypothetical protein